jgi:hypothetical protein
MSGRQQLGFAIAAAMAGLAWGYLRHRGDRRASTYALLQALEWFVAYGGAAALIERAQQALGEGGDDLDEPERVTHMRQVVRESIDDEAADEATGTGS